MQPGDAVESLLPSWETQSEIATRGSHLGQPCQLCHLGIKSAEAGWVDGTLEEQLSLSALQIKSTHYFENSSYSIA